MNANDAQTVTVERGLRAASIGTWHCDDVVPQRTAELIECLGRIDLPLAVIESHGKLGFVNHGHGTLGADEANGHALHAYCPPTPVTALGDATFRADHRLRYAYVAGAMANGIASVDLVAAIAKAGMLGFFGAAGLSLARVEAAIDALEAGLGSDYPYGINMIHSLNEPAFEEAIADLFIRRRVRLVEASAYLKLTLPIVRYRVHGLHRDANGNIVAPNRVVAKVSRVEVAERFFSPPPKRLLTQLLERGDITEEEAELAAFIPMAQDLTAEADSGGHTDGRPALALVPTMLALRDRCQEKFDYDCRLRVGAAGGIASPESAAAAFAMGASYVLTGTINQACRESGSSDLVREMLAQAGQADTAMAPSADMFELGVKVQVLKRGTLFAMRAQRLYDLYRAYNSFDALPEKERTQVEEQILCAGFDEVWTRCIGFFEERDPDQIERAERDAHHKMALVFRWYLGLASSWANSGEESRKVDFQVWCGPAMGAFNEWTRSSHLAEVAERRVAHVARNLLYGACVVARCQLLRSQGVQLPAALTRVAPATDSDLARFFEARD